MLSVIGLPNGLGDSKMQWINIESKDNVQDDLVMDAKIADN